MVLRAGFHGTVGQPSAQVIDGSLKFDQSKQTYLKRTPGSAGNRRTWTYSTWIKRGDFASSERGLFSTFGSAHPTTALKFTTSQTLEFLDYQSGYICQKITNQVFRDTGWYHIVIVIDTTLSTAADRYKLYVNGERVTSFGTNTNISTQNQQLDWNSATEHNLFMHGNEDTPYDGMGSQTYFIDGAALGPENFGFTDPLTNTWRPKKFEHLSTSIATQYSGASALTWDDNPIGSIYTLSNGNRTATAGEGGSSGYTGADVWSNAIPANSTTAWTLEITNSDSVGGWYFTDSQTASGTHPDERGGNSLGLRNQDADAGWFGTFATANGSTSQGHILPLPGCETFGSRRVDFVVYRPASGNGKVWVKNNGSSTWVGGGNPSNTSSTPSFVIPDGNTYFGYTFYDRSNGDQIATFDGDGSIQQKIGANSFYLPMDGNSPIGEDKSGKGNDFTPVNFGGFNSIDKATGALPILDTVNGGNYATVGVRTDAYASNLVLALPLVSSANDVSNRINSGSTTKAITVSGSSASNVQSNFYNGSFIFDGSNDYFTLSPGADFAFGTGDFTIECWCYSINRGNYDYIIDGRNSGQTTGTWTLGYGYSGVSPFTLDFATGSTTLLSCPTASNPEAGRWFHVAIARSGTSLKMFIDGVEVASATDSTDFSTSPSTSYIGTRYSQQHFWDGYMQDIRVYKGVAKYTSNFVPASTNPGILPDTPSGVSGGSKLTKITEGAVSFDGTNDTLSVADHADFTFGSGDFTMEAFVYNRSSGYRSIVMKYGGSPASSSWFWSMYNGQNQFYYYSGSNEPAVTSSKTHYNKWVHCAVSREGNTIRIFDDGQLTGTLDVSSYATMNDSTVPLDIGADYADNYDMDGFISNVRIVKGTALYTSNFTPPTAPLTNVTNTKLLCCQSNTSATAVAAAPNLSAINDGTHWSGATLTNGSNLAGLFDESLSTNAQQSTNGTAASVTNFGPVNVSSTVSFYSPDGDARYTLNGGSEVSVSGTGWHDISFSGTLTSFTFQAPGNARIFIYGMKIDGTQLVDIITPNGNVAATTFNPFNTDINTVRGQETGYATWNPLTNRGVVTTSDGNLTANAVNSGYGYALSTIPVSSGKYYCEISFEGTMAHSTNYNYIGIVPTDSAAIYTGQDIFRANGALSIDSDSSVIRGTIGTGSNDTNNTYQSSYGFDENDTIGIAIDCDTPQVTFYKNGTSIGTFPHTMQSNKSWVLFVNDWANAADFTGYILNAGQKPFKFPPPDGFQPLNTANTRPETVISRPDQYVAATTYSGNGGTKDIVVGHKPDFLWIKNRADSSAAAHRLFDSVRGANKTIFSNLTNDELEVANSLNSFNSDGFSVGSGNWVNGDGDGIVAWSWKAGGDKNTFNVDDVGYASASDVNMSVGALNSATYNTSENWVTTGTTTGSPYNSSYTFSPLFDGDLTGLGPQSNSTSTQYVYTFGSALSATADSIIFYSTSNTANVPAGSGAFYINGAQVTTSNCTRLNDSSPYKYRMDGLTTLSSIGSQQLANMTGIEVNGKLLVDSNAHTPPNLPSTAATGCSVGTKQGFSIIKYTGPNDTNNHTVPHGLSQEPNFILAKNLDASYNWDIYHSSLANDKYLIFTQAAPRNQGFSGRPTSTVFKTEHDYSTNENQEYIAYCWHDVPGLQKFGSYGGADAFVELGFRPAVLIIKSESSSRNWIIIDSARDTFNPSDRALLVNDSAQEDDNSVYAIDFLSNGFKIRGSNGQIDGDSSYIYAAWAAAPSVNLYGGGANAR